MENNNVIRLVRDPEATLSTHMDVVQNFRLMLESMSGEERKGLLDTLRFPNNTATLRDELEEWVSLLYWNGFLNGNKGVEIAKQQP